MGDPNIGHNNGQIKFRSGDGVVRSRAAAPSQALLSASGMPSRKGNKEVSKQLNHIEEERRVV
jgi:hypothetical protein